MVTEKAWAAAESWNAIAMAGFAFQQSLLREMFRHRPWGSRHAGTPLRTWTAYLRQSERGFASAMAPYHRRATANARRLSRRAR